MIKKKGRKSKSYYENLNKDNSNNLIDDISKLLIIYTNKDESNNEIKIPKKRGRKPKGGKIVEVKDILITNNEKHNIILHLKCFLSDLHNNNYIKYSPKINNIDNYNILTSNLQYDYIKNINDISNNQLIKSKTILNLKENTDEINNYKINAHEIYNNNIYDNEINNNEINNNEINNNEINNNEINNNEINNKQIINKKLKELSYKIKGNENDKKSACFWCTYSFDNFPILIPKYYNNNTNNYNCYGSFCSPECACAFLMNENIDSSKKFERYHLLNNIYGKIYNYNKNIKPAPCPYYLLAKYGGNLSINEYRKLLQYEKLLLHIEKPLTKVYPEIYEENDDFLINAKIISKQR